VHEQISRGLGGISCFLKLGSWARRLEGPREFIHRLSDLEHGILDRLERFFVCHSAKANATDRSALGPFQAGGRRRRRALVYKAPPNDQQATAVSCWNVRGRGLSQLESGQGMVEYAFILILIALVVIVMLVTTGGQVKDMFSDITYTLHNQAGL
jgi:pilus assembly protein Flp/PilA